MTAVVRRNRKLLVAACVVVLLASAVLALEWWTNQLPPLAVPKRVAPVPNAFDTLKHARGALVRQVGTANIRPSSHIDPKSAKTVTDWGTRLDQQRLLQANTSCLGGIDLALTQAYLAPIEFNWDQDFTWYGGTKDLAYLLILQVHVRRDDGRLREAIDAACRVMRLGQLIATNDLVIGRHLGCSCQTLGANALFEMADHMDANSLAYALDRLDRFRSTEPRIEDTLQNEEVYTRMGIRRIAKMGILALRKEFSDATALKMLVASKRQADRAAQLYFTRGAEAFRLPYARALALLEPPHDVVCEAVCADLRFVLFNERRLMAIRTLLAAYLWVRLERLRLGKVPAALDGRFLDPFGTGQSLGYRTKGDQFVLYSVGPDGKDDGGRPTGRPPYYGVVAELTGDIVARVNTR